MSQLVVVDIEAASGIVTEKSPKVLMNLARNAMQTDLHDTQKKRNGEQLAENETLSDYISRKWTDEETIRLVKCYLAAVVETRVPNITDSNSQSSTNISTAVGSEGSRQESDYSPTEINSKDIKYSKIIRHINREQLFERVCSLYYEDHRKCESRLSIPGSVTVARRRTPKSLLEKFKFLRMTYYYIREYDEAHSSRDIDIMQRNNSTGDNKPYSAWWLLSIRQQRDILGKSRTPMSRAVYDVLHDVMAQIASMNRFTNAGDTVQVDADEASVYNDLRSKRPRLGSFQIEKPQKASVSETNSTSQSMSLVSGTESSCNSRSRSCDHVADYVLLASAIDRNTRAIENMTEFLNKMVQNVDQVSELLQEIRNDKK
ncbi:hypothetical protein V1511DRAFT_498363 [Dipodascopsis uninucleata]